MRPISTHKAALRTPLDIAPPALAGALLALALPLLPAPAAAQSADPWHGISVTVTPPAEQSPYEAAQRSADEEASVTSAQAEPAAEAVLAEPETEDDTAPSLWTSLDLGLGGADDAEPETPPPNKMLPARPQSLSGRKPAALPTSVEGKQGAASWSVTSSANTDAPVSGALERSTGGGSGEIKGRVGLEQDNLTVYSSGTLGAAASGATPSLYDNIAIGSTYSVPLAPLGMKDEKFGASVEVNNSQQLTTGVELRAPAAGYERFISVQRQVGPDSTPSGVVKAGVLGKF